MDIKGKVLRIEKLEELGASKFKKQDVYLDRTRKDDYSDQVYPNFTKLTFMGDKTDLVKTINIGDIVTAKYNVKGRFFELDEKELFNQDLAVLSIQVDRKAQSTAAHENRLA